MQPRTGLIDHPETPAEELASTITHGIGAAAAVAGLVVLVALAAGSGDAMRVVTLSVFGATLFACYLASTLYHALPAGRWKHRALLCDYASIYLLIAGTYTPVLLVQLGGPWGWSLFGVVWTLAVVGIVLKTRCVDRFRTVSTLLYVAMGWIILVAAKPAVEALAGGALAWLVAGGVAYTAGVAFFLWQRLPFNHAIWHLFVIAGSACHFCLMLFHVAPVR
ncbi:MAG TPA: hemolysin III family protein [Tepidisphaeraceae bacterium]|nr:hemolysin III family protein [Tepidisphaeraceae bacterium]